MTALDGTVKKPAGKTAAEKKTTSATKTSTGKTSVKKAPLRPKPSAKKTETAPKVAATTEEKKAPAAAAKKAPEKTPEKTAPATKPVGSTQKESAKPEEKPQGTAPVKEEKKASTAPASTTATGAEEAGANAPVDPNAVPDAPAGEKVVTNLDNEDVGKLFGKLQLVQTIATDTEFAPGTQTMTNQDELVRLANVPNVMITDSKTKPDSKYIAFPYSFGFIVKNTSDEVIPMVKMPEVSKFHMPERDEDGNFKDDNPQDTRRIAEIYAPKRTVLKKFSRMWGHPIKGLDNQSVGEFNYDLAPGAATFVTFFELAATLSMSMKLAEHEGHLLDEDVLAPFGGLILLSATLKKGNKAALKPAKTHESLVQLYGYPYERMVQGNVSFRQGAPAEVDAEGNRVPGSRRNVTATDYNWPKVVSLNEIAETRGKKSRYVYEITSDFEEVAQKAPADLKPAYEEARQFLQMLVDASVYVKTVRDMEKRMKAKALRRNASVSRPSAQAQWSLSRGNLLAALAK